MRNVVIVEAVRTGFGKMGGSLRQFPMSHLAAMAIDGLLDKTQLLERGGILAGLGGFFFAQKIRNRHAEISCNFLGRFCR